MFIIASNITTRDKKIEHIFQQAKGAAWNTVTEPRTARSTYNGC